MKDKIIAPVGPYDYEGSKPLRRVEVVCHICKNKWTTISDADYVTCPNCTRKTRRLKLK